jgi:hypothetical protein
MYAILDFLASLAEVYLWLFWGFVLCVALAQTIHESVLLPIRRAWEKARLGSK